jgi:hypothetical protein
VVPEVKVLLPRLSWARWDIVQDADQNTTSDKKEQAGSHFFAVVLACCAGWWAFFLADSSWLGKIFHLVGEPGRISFTVQTSRSRSRTIF